MFQKQFMVPAYWSRASFVMFSLWVWIVLSWGISKTVCESYFHLNSSAHTLIVRLTVVLEHPSEVGTFTLICVYAIVSHAPCSGFSSLMALNVQSKNKMCECEPTCWLVLSSFLEESFIAQRSLFWPVYFDDWLGVSIYTWPHKCVSNK